MAEVIEFSFYDLAVGWRKFGMRGDGWFGDIGESVIDTAHSKKWIITC
jgi:hypothetical protein